ncbi:hypothetical protein E4P82_15120, partial [Candidatus Competibacter phosphatis]|nr:hypothetical protein [Candidatus Competibacter phosphatis]
FLNRMVDFADHIGKPIQLLYYRPTTANTNPGGALLGKFGKSTGTAQNWPTLRPCWRGQRAMTWKGVHPVVELTRKVYEKGISLSKEAMQAVEARLERHPELPKWDILIRPACMV